MIYKSHESRPSCLKLSTVNYRRDQQLSPPREEEEAAASLLALQQKIQPKEKPKIKPTDNTVASMRRFIPAVAKMTEIPIVRPNYHGTKLKSNTVKSQIPFLLMTLLSEEKYSDILSFLPDGKTFYIRFKEFSTYLMPRFFHATNCESFLHHLDRWGFKKGKREDPEAIFFYHPQFRKGDWDSIWKLKPFKSPHCTKSIMRCSKKNSRTEKNSHLGSLFTSPRLQKFDCGAVQLDCSRQTRVVSQSDAIKFKKSIIDTAIDCLMYDEDHTYRILARHEHFLKKNSMLPSDMLFSSIMRNMLAESSSVASRSTPAVMVQDLNR